MLCGSLAKIANLYGVEDFRIRFWPAKYKYGSGYIYINDTTLCDNPQHGKLLMICPNCSAFCVQGPFMLLIVLCSISFGFQIRPKKTSHLLALKAGKAGQAQHW